MRELWRAIKEFYRAKKSPAPAPLPILPAAPAAAPDWGPEQMVSLNGFLSSATGRTLLLRGRAIQFRNATEACKDVFHTAHSAGAAKGFGECLDWIESLSRACRVEQDSSPEIEGQTDTLPPGEAALRDSMSP